MKTSELRKLIREEARKVIATNKNKSTKVNEGVFDSLMKAISAKVKLDGSILAKPEAKAPIADLDKAAKGKPETLTAFTKMAKQMGVDLVQNMEKVKEAVVYAYIKKKFKNWIAGSYRGVYDPDTSEFSLIPASAGGNALTSESQDSMQVALKRTIREAARKRRLNEEVSVSELEKMKATVGYIAHEGPVYDLLDEYDEMTAEDAEIVSFEKGSKKVLDYAKDYGGNASQIKQMVVKLNKLKTMGTKFVLYGLEADLNLGVL